MEEQSNYYEQALKMKEKLATVSPSMCLAKWLQVSMHLTNGLTQSCYHPPTHKISESELKKNPRALHNTKIKKQERKDMLQGKRPKGCEYCWKIEDVPGDHMSDRFYRSGEPWAREAFDEVTQNAWDYDINPRYVEVNFNHACNLKCSYCSPHISSTWYEEIKRHGAYPTIVPHNDISYFQKQKLMPILNKEVNVYQEAFWKWWPQLYQDLKVFRMTGGEPLLDKNTFKILDWIIENPKPDLELAITSNLCPPDELLEKFLVKIEKIVMENKVKRFMLFPSIDTWGKQAEYIRHGLDFQQFWDNVNKILERVPKGLVTFIVTMNSLSAPNLLRLIQGFVELQKEHNRDYHRIFFDTPYLRYPLWQSLQTLPKSYVQNLEAVIEYMQANPVNDRYIGIRDFQLARMERVTSWMQQEMEEKALLESRVNFYRFFQEHDKRRNTNFLATFPEMEDYWKECKRLNETMAF